MGSTDFGTQSIFMDYRFEAKSQQFNNILYNLLPQGIYSGFSLTKVNDSTVTVGTGIVYISDSNRDLTVRIETSTTENLTVSSATPFIIFRLDWLNTENNYMDMLAVADGSIQAGDIIVGRCVYTGATMSSTFDTTRRQYSSLQDVEDNKNNFKVKPTEPATNTVTVEAGDAIINNKYVEFAGGTSGNFSNTTNGRIDWVYIDESGNIQIKEGTDSITPSAPLLPTNGMVVAKVTRGASTSVVKGNVITQIKPNRNYASIDTLDSADDGGVLYWNDTTQEIKNESVFTYNDSTNTLTVPSATISSGGIDVTGDSIFQNDVSIQASTTRTLLGKNSSGNNNENLFIIEGEGDVTGRKGQIIFYRYANSNQVGLKINTYDSGIVNAMELDHTGTVEFAKALTVSSGGIDVTGDSTISGDLDLIASSTEARGLDIGLNRSGDGASFIDLIGDATYSDFGCRLQRGGGSNANSSLLHRGTGELRIQATDAGSVVIRTNSTNAITINSSQETTFAQAVTVSSGGIDITGNSDITGTLDVSSTLTISTGGIDVTGTSSITGDLDLTASSTEARRLDIGLGRAGDGASFIDLIGDATYSDFGCRLQRGGGSNANSSLLHRGTGELRVQATDAGSVVIRTNSTDAITVNSSQETTFAKGLTVSTGGIDVTGDSIFQNDVSIQASTTRILLGKNSSGSNNENLFVIEGEGDVSDRKGEIIFYRYANSNQVGIKINTYDSGTVNAMELDHTGTVEFAKALTVSTGGIDVTGDSTIAGVLDLTASSTESRGIKVGLGRAGDGASFLNLVGDSTYVDYGCRLLRGDTGANTDSYLFHRGTGNLRLEAQDAGAVLIRTNDATAITVNSSQETTFSQAVTLSSTLAVTSTSTFSAGVTISTGGIDVTGNSDITGTLDVSSTLTVSSGGIDVTGNSTIDGNLTVEGTATFNSLVNINSKLYSSVSSSNKTAGYFVSNSVPVYSFTSSDNEDDVFSTLAPHIATSLSRPVFGYYDYGTGTGLLYLMSQLNSTTIELFYIQEDGAQASRQYVESDSSSSDAFTIMFF